LQAAVCSSNAQPLRRDKQEAPTRSPTLRAALGRAAHKRNRDSGHPHQAVIATSLALTPALSTKNTVNPGNSPSSRTAAPPVEFVRCGLFGGVRADLFGVQVPMTRGGTASASPSLINGLDRPIRTKWRTRGPRSRGVCLSGQRPTGGVRRLRSSLEARTMRSSATAAFCYSQPSTSSAARRFSSSARRSTSVSTSMIPPRSSRSRRRRSHASAASTAS